MAADWLFWAIAAAAAALCLGAVLAPLLRGAARGERRASHDMQVHRDQLREIDTDLARGVLSEAEAAATRIEVSRRLLAAAEAEAAERTATTAPRTLRRAAPLLFAALVLAGLGLYALLGAPGLPDQPLAARQARETDDATLVARLQKALETRPDDLVGHRLLAQSLAGLDRWPEAAAAQAQVLAILGDQATASDLVDLAEAQIIAAGGFVHPEAAATLQRALTLDPQDPAGRYYAALADLQAGRADAAYRTWSTLVADGPPDAPWIAPARAGMAEAQRLASAPPGPSAADLAAAEDMPPAERQAMIQAMVDQLSDRLAREGGPPEDWARLVRSLGVLDRRGDAAAILAEARQAYANDGAAQEILDAAAHDAGIAQ